MIRIGSMIGSFGIMLWVIALSYTVAVAQGSRKPVTSSADLPRFSYDVPEKLSDLASNETAYRAFAAKVRSDLGSLLRDFDISDKATLKEIHATLGELDLQDGDLKGALAHFQTVRDLEEKPELKVLPMYFESEIIAKARERSSAAAGDKFVAALRDVITETLDRMPASVLPAVRQFRFGYDLINDSFLAGILDGTFTKNAKKNGNRLFGGDANKLVGMYSVQKFLVPVTGVFAKAFDIYLESRKSTANPNIWPSRAVDLTGRKELSPVIAAVWDTGVDASVFPGRMFVNVREKPDGKDNDRNGYVDDIHGIGFDLRGKYTTEPLLAMNEADSRKYADWIKDQRTFVKLQEAVEDADTRAMKKKLASQTPAEVTEETRLIDFLSHRAHGTQVASVITDGNPAVRILSARRTWRDATGQNDSLTTDLEYAQSFAKRIKAYADYFRKQNVRVVNMSWSLTRAGIAENLERNLPSMPPKARSATADKSFSVIRHALLDAFRSSPQILFVCSAGNINSDAGFNESIPASLDAPNLITVGAVDERGAAASFTSFGSKVTIYAQGMKVPAAVPGGEVIMFNGTSAAAPGVANLAAKLFAIDPKLSVAAVIDLIRNGADVSPADARLKLINPKRTLELLTKTPPR